MPLLSDDAHHLHATARRIRARADGLRTHAVRLAARAAATRWHSPAAARFRSDVDGLVVRMRAVADQLDGAAHRLDRHADHVAMLAAVADAPERLVTSVRHLIGL